MKKLLLAAALGLVPIHATAQEAGVCYTHEAVTAAVMKSTPGAKEVITLKSIDIGFDELADVTIYGDGSGHYLAMAFIGGCYDGHREMNDEQVEAFINEHTKRASPRT